MPRHVHVLLLNAGFVVLRDVASGDNLKNEVVRRCETHALQRHLL